MILGSKRKNLYCSEGSCHRVTNITKVDLNFHKEIRIRHEIKMYIWIVIESTFCVDHRLMREKENVLTRYTP